MSEQEPMTTEVNEQETDEQQITLDDLSDEELGKFVDDPEGYEPPEQKEEEPDEPEAEDDADTEESVEEEAEATEEETETEETKEEEPEVTEESLRIQELELEVKDSKLREKRFESLVGRDAGRMGYLEKQIKALSERPAQQVDTDPDIEPRVVSDPNVLSDIAGLKQSQETILSGQVAGAIESTAEAFKSSSGRDFSDKEFVEAFSEGLKESGVDFGNVYTASDPKAAASEVKFACESALVYVERKENKALKEELAARSADSAGKMRDRKRAMTASKPPSTKAPKKKAKTLEEMTNAEAAAHVDNLP